MFRKLCHSDSTHELIRKMSKSGQEKPWKQNCKMQKSEHRKYERNNQSHYLHNNMHKGNSRYNKDYQTNCIHISSQSLKEGEDVMTFSK